MSKVKNLVIIASLVLSSGCGTLERTYNETKIGIKSYTEEIKDGEQRGIPPLSIEELIFVNRYLNSSRNERRRLSEEAEIPYVESSPPPFPRMRRIYHELKKKNKLP
ncbi:hypothetical protein J4461_02610 [Candidatus Pacearchaeota archaeon]|nr:hypothetical protein [Candidatus Pacearchaeota archaeon]